MPFNNNLKLWDMNVLSHTPAWETAEDMLKYNMPIWYNENGAGNRRPSGVKPIWYESEQRFGMRTRVFAWLGIPSTKSSPKIPGIILVHGGGGTAFASWVAKWNRRGYAAIALDTCGHIPMARKYGQWKFHEHPGPANYNDFTAISLSRKDQWPYHSVAAIIRAHSLLRSFPMIDTNKIGISGISWGGFLTCITIGVDHRYRFAIPVYGCGHLAQDSPWLPKLNKLTSEDKDKWLSYWDPKHYLSNARVPTLWVTGSNDPAYNLKMLSKSVDCHGGDTSISIAIRYGHSHTHGWNRSEIGYYADCICNNIKNIMKIEGPYVEGKKAYIKYSRKIKPLKAWLCFTNDNHAWVDKYWHKKTATIKRDCIKVDIPNNSKSIFINCIDINGNIISSKPYFTKDH